MYLGSDRFPDCLRLLLDRGAVLDASGKKYKESFVCSVDGNQHQLVHDSEMPRTLRDLQDIPKALAEIAEQLKKLTPVPEAPSEEAVQEMIERMRRNMGGG